jgi:transposase-like protein
LPVAEAAFQRAKIAEDEAHYADALKHYQKAHID